MSIHEQTMEESVEQMPSAAERVKNQFEQAENRLKTQAEDAWEDFNDLIRKHPAKAMGATLVAGLVFGSLAIAASRRRSSSASDQLRDLAGTGIDAWDRVKEGFTQATCALKDALDDAAEKFK